MEFKVIFRRKEYNTGYAAIDTADQPVGLDAVDEVRENLGIQVPLELFNGAAWRFRDNPEIKITEEIARQSGHFRKVYCRVVIVQPDALNDFVQIVHEVDRDPEVGTVKKVRFYQEVNKKALLEAWEDAGFPLEWGIQEEEKE